MALGRLGKYERVDVLGHGVSGIVYLAWDTLLKKQIALKEIDLQAADVNRFIEEARVMDRLNHPNIVRVNGVDRIDGRVVIDMEYVKGRNLQEILREEGRLPLDRALDIAVQTLDALDYAHRMRTVHRDIKPANILINRAGEVKLVDFGLAEILATNSYAGGAGTYAYMAPEDFAEEHHSDHQSDIWAVGVTLYEMLTAARPFNVLKTKDPFAWRRVLLNESPTPLSAYLEDAPHELQAVLDRALAKDKAARYRTAGEFRDDLKAIREDREPVHAAATTTVGAVHDTALYRNGASQHVDGTYRFAGAPGAGVPPRYADEEYAPAEKPRTMNTLLGSFTMPLKSDEEPAPAAKSRSGLWGLTRQKTVLPAKVDVVPNSLHFGEVRKGDDRSGRVTVRVEGGDGKWIGRVTAAPAWTSVYPATLNRRRRTLTVIAHSGRVWQTGDFEDWVKLDTTAGPVAIPIGIRVLKPRPRFHEVSYWLVPLFLAVLLPSLTVGWGAQFAAARYLVPAAALGSAMLAGMLLMVAYAADLGFGERLGAGLLLAILTMTQGVTVGLSQRAGHTSVGASMLATGVPIGFCLLLQIFNRRHWKLWAWAIVLLSFLASCTFLSVLSGRM